MELWMRNIRGLEQRHRDVGEASLLAMLEAELPRSGAVVGEPYDAEAARQARKEAGKAFEPTGTLTEERLFDPARLDLIEKIQALELARYHRWGIVIGEIPY
jgi:hypothetical protein